MATVTVILGDQQLGIHPVRHHPFTVGRDAACDIPIDNIGISRNHCRFLWEGGRFLVEDAGSSNGTFVNGERVQKAEVKDGDEIRAGKFRLIFAVAPGEAAPPAKGEALEVAPERPAAVTDGMKTFQMSAGDLRAKAGGGPGVSSQRASDVATGGATPEGVSKKALYVVLAVFGAIIVALGALAILLATR